jgi:hypothetical protein
MITKLLISLNKAQGLKRYRLEVTEPTSTLAQKHLDRPVTPILYSSKRLFHKWFAMRYKDLWCMYNFLIEQLHLCHDLYFKVNHATFLEFSYWVWKNTETQHFTYPI